MIYQEYRITYHMSWCDPSRYSCDVNDISHDNCITSHTRCTHTVFFIAWRCCVADVFFACVSIIRRPPYSRPVVIFVNHCSCWRTDDLPFWTDTPWVRQRPDQDCLPLHHLVLSRVLQASKRVSEGNPTEGIADRK